MKYIYQYPRPALTADCVVFAKEGEETFVLLIQRKNDPYKGSWAFPGGFMNIDETTEEAAARELEEETGLQVEHLTQIGAYSKVDRDPRDRVVTVAYSTILNERKSVRGNDDAKEARWFPITKLPSLAFDHEKIMADAIKRML